ncbi:MAG TPA: glycosyltransferase family 39 protein [Terriglobales bacterium]|nr:glycosyltransferase family 39 protein [Terriglobales bacterium]
MSLNNSDTHAENHPVSDHGSQGVKFDPGLLVVLSLPWVVLRFDTTWLFAYATSSFGFIDPWVYFGFFFDLTQHIRVFKGAYFTTRLTWTVPGAVVYHVFSPLTATYVLHLALFYCATLSLYFILKITVSRRVALLATLLMAFHSYFLWSVGWPYIDGAANTYVLLTLAALAFAARSPRPKWWLVVAGALAAKAFYCQFFLIVFCPLIFGVYYFARREMGNRRSTAEWKPFAWGFAFVTAAYGLFNMAINGRFLFFINSIGTAAKLVINHNPYNDSTYGWLSGATWLVLPAITTIGAIVCLARRKSILAVPNAEFLLFWQRYLLLSVLIMVFWQVVGQPVLQLSTYASYMMPAVFLALGSQIAIVTHRLSKSTLAFVYLGVFIVGILPLVLEVDSPLMLTLQHHPFLFPFAIGIIAVVAIGAEVQYMGALAVLALSISLGALNAATSTRTWTHCSPHGEASQKSAMLAIVDSIRLTRELDPTDNLYFWYDATARLGRLHRSVASTYLWAYRLQSETFPDFGPKAPPPQRRILILTEDPDHALEQAQASLSKAGLTANVVTQRKIQEGPFRWDVIEIQITRAAPTN